MSRTPEPQEHRGIDSEDDFYQYQIRGEAPPSDDDDRDDLHDGCDQGSIAQWTRIPAEHLGDADTQPQETVHAADEAEGQLHLGHDPLLAQRCPYDEPEGHEQEGNGAQETTDSSYRPSRGSGLPHVRVNAEEWHGVDE